MHANGRYLQLCHRRYYNIDLLQKNCQDACTSLKGCVGYEYSTIGNHVRNCYLYPSKASFTTCPDGFEFQPKNEIEESGTEMAETVDDLVLDIYGYGQTCFGNMTSKNYFCS